MMLPSIFGENLLDDFFDDDWNAWGYSDTSLMNTDVKENEKDYELTMSMPGVQKDNVKAELNDGYLTISASTDTNNDEKDKDGHYIRRERYSGSCQRSFYVGKDVTEDDITIDREHTGALPLVCQYTAGPVRFPLRVCKK